MLFSVGANATHGLRRTNDDKRRAVLTLLSDAEWSQWSDREIAKRCGVSPDTVGRIRAESPLTESDSEKPIERIYTNKHGTQAKMKTGGIGKRPKAALTSPEVTPPDSTSEPVADDDARLEARHTIEMLSAENEKLRDRLAVEQMDLSEEGKLEATNQIADLRAQVRALTAERDAMRVSRDNFQAENAELKKQLAMQQREPKKAGALA